VEGPHAHVLAGKCTSLLPPLQQQEATLNIIALVPYGVFFFFFPLSQKYPNYHAGELGKDGFYVVLSPQHSIVRGLFICVFTVT
jgi:hypothetical protein